MEEESLWFTNRFNDKCQWRESGCLETSSVPLQCSNYATDFPFGVVVFGFINMYLIPSQALSICHACVCNEITKYRQPLAGKQFAAVLLLPYLNISYVSVQGRAVTVHEHSDLHPVTLAIWMSRNATEKGFTLWGWFEDCIVLFQAWKVLVGESKTFWWLKKHNRGKNSTNNTGT